jgi:hypothetical protein
VSAFGDLRAEIAGKLIAAGVAATTDPAANPPFVLVGPANPRTSPNAGVGAWSVIVPISIATPPPSDAATLAWREDQLEAVLIALGPIDGDDGTYTFIGKDLPAYRLEYRTEAPNPNC